MGNDRALGSESQRDNFLMFRTKLLHEWNTQLFERSVLKQWEVKVPFSSMTTKRDLTVDCRWGMHNDNIGMVNFGWLWWWFLGSRICSYEYIWGKRRSCDENSLICTLLCAPGSCLAQALNMNIILFFSITSLSTNKWTQIYVGRSHIHWKIKVTKTLNMGIYNIINWKYLSFALFKWSIIEILATSSVDNVKQESVKMCHISYLHDSQVPA